MDRGPAGLQSMGSQELDTTVRLTFLSFPSFHLKEHVCCTQRHAHIPFPHPGVYVPGPPLGAPPWAFLQHLGLGQFQALGLK